MNGYTACLVESGHHVHLLGAPGPPGIRRFKKAPKHPRIDTCLEEDTGSETEGQINAMDAWLYSGTEAAQNPKPHLDPGCPNS